MYDRRCEELARVFMPDPNEYLGIDATTENLAQTIQDAIESYLSQHQLGSDEAEVIAALRAAAKEAEPCD